MHKYAIYMYLDENARMTSCLYLKFVLPVSLDLSDTDEAMQIQLMFKLTSFVYWMK